MGILSGILNSSGSIVDKALNVIDDLTTSDEERLAADIDLYKAQTERIQVSQEEHIEEVKAETVVSLAQVDLNKEEAKSSSAWVAGWRPAIGWICGLSLAWHFFLAEFLQWIFIIFGGTATFPQLADANDLIVVLLGMLGLGGMRTYEKMKGLPDRKFEMPMRRKKK